MNITEYKFALACSNGDMPVTEAPIQDWVIDFAFTEACAHGHLQVAQWLLETYPAINVTSEVFQLASDNDLLHWLSHNESLFKSSCKNNDILLAQHMCDLCPDIYYFETRANKIINWHIIKN